MPKVEETRESGGYGWINHHITYEQSVKRDEVMQFVRDAKYFGYHPAGYGGSLLPHEQEVGTKWRWSHSASCD